MKISVFGLGYIGCVSAACLARSGHRVIGVDVNTAKVEAINAGSSPIVEPGLAELVAEMGHAGRLRATASSDEAIADSELALICVGTPSCRNGRLDTAALVRVCRTIGEDIARQERPFTVVVRSTMLPGSTEKLVIPALRLAGAGTNIKVAVNPEFLREGSALTDFSQPPFTLIGSEDAETIARLREVYAGVEAPFLSLPIKTAEMMKYAFNSFHALKVSFANEIGDACEALGADAQEVMRVFCLDRKLNISPAYLRPGFAFGGSCLPKDLRALSYAARTADVELPLIGSILPANKARIENAVEAILATGKRRIGIVGLSFKPNTDDLRESPMVAIVEALIGKGCDVRIRDRHVSMARLMGANRRYIEEEIPHIASLLCDKASDFVAHCDVLVVGNNGDDALEALAAAPPTLELMDLTRSAYLPPRIEPQRRPSAATESATTETSQILAPIAAAQP
jgi:GDP-mannose 6-dehydrogenase